MPMRSLLKVSLVFVMFATAFADVAPDPGFTHVSADLVLETAADLSDYRFFLESPIEVEEIKLTGGSTTIPAAGRGGATRYAKLIAVPRKDLGEISGDLSPSSGLLASMIREGRFPNAHEVLAHSFQATVSIAEKPFWKSPIYRLTLENGVVAAAKEERGAGLTRSALTYAIPGLIGGVLIAIGIAIVGIWLFRRSRNKV